VEDFTERYHLYWGDLHNHNAVGYAKGSLARSIEIAREHLDFFAFTGHASWHDMPQMPKNQHMHWVNGFKAHAQHWPRTRHMIAEANDDAFVALLGYEWHSSSFGDHCIIFPDDQEELFLPDDVESLFDFAQAKGALAIPHHVAYKQGWRGANWSHFRPSITPVVEIFSEQGCTLADRSPYPMILHSNGGRVTTQTVRHQLQTGKRFGFVASTDDHFGYPGAYGEGVAGVWAESLSREALFEAIRARRTISASGDRIALAFFVNDRPMGSELPFTPERRIRVHADAPDSVESIEIVRGERTVHRYFPEDHLQAAPSLPARAQCRVQYGWGPWSALDLERVCEWEMAIAIRGGRFNGFERCFQTGPFGEEIIDHAKQVSDRKITLHSYTSRKDAFLLDPTKALILDLEADADAHLEITLTKPVEMTHAVAIADLVSENSSFFTGVFTSESVTVHRLVFSEESRCSVEWEETRSAEDGPDSYYVRVKQHNGHYAWSSPVWVG